MNLAGGAFARFCIVGALGFLVDVAVLYALALVLGWYGARVLSFLCAATFTWVLNRRHTFAAGAAEATSRAAVGREYLRYLLSMLGGGAVNYLAYSLVLQWSASRQAPLLGVAVGSVAGLVVNYALARHVVFKKRPSP
ncbi:GtrA family protein [Pseudorhodoferax sp. Leaf267]|uniref:GtrA family protein n=1 Tax=Pseudorhodoferax sp. Leaf267 TaxID=1736316 RepID=UPI0006F56B7B|nr:GtrA family protein [Pseudorhodoferax sp. Leaf267]KQP13295.1 polysaccharide synthesis protein GtrA [Pseudorhodoferax sp. Leaf267]